MIASTAVWVNKATNSTISFLSNDKTFSVVGVVTLLVDPLCALNVPYTNMFSTVGVSVAVCGMSNFIHHRLIQTRMR